MSLLCLDLDGTLVDNALVEVGGKLQRRQHELFTQPVLLENRLNVLGKLAEEDEDIRFAIVTNQGGVAWGYHTQAEVCERIACALRQLFFFGSRPFSIHVCFSHPRATVDGFRSGADRRKPSPVMLHEAMRAHDVAPATTVMIGDRDEDREAAEAAGVDFEDAGTFFA